MDPRLVHGDGGSRCFRVWDVVVSLTQRCEDCAKQVVKEVTSAPSKH